MNYTFVLAAFICLSSAVAGQTPDSTSIFFKKIGKQIDSLRQKGQYAEGIQLGLAALERFQQKTAGSNPDLVRAQLNLVSAYIDINDWQNAETLLKSAKTAQESANSTQTSNYVGTLSRLGNVYRRTGKFAEAEQLYLQILDICERLPDMQSTRALNLNRLALLKWELGNYDEAEPLFWRAGEIWEKNHTRKSVQFAGLLNNVALLKADKGEHGEVEKLLLEAQSIWKELLGENDPQYAGNLVNVGTYYKGQKNYQPAEAFYRQAIGILEKYEEAYFPYLASAFEGLGDLFFETARHAEAKILFEKGARIWAKYLGEGNNNYAHALYNLGKINSQLGQRDSALFYFSRHADLRQRLFLEGADFMSEKELSEYLKLYRDEQIRVQNFAFEHFDDTPQLTALIFDNALFYKGLLLQNSIGIAKRVFSENASGGLKSTYGAWCTKRSLLAHALSKPLAKRDSAAIQSLEREVNRLEKEMVKNNELDQKRSKVNWQRVRNALASGEAAVEFIHLDNRESSQHLENAPVHYVAVVLRPRGQGAGPDATLPHFVPLFEEKQLENYLQKTQSRPESVAAFYASRSGHIEEKVPTYGSELYDLIWKPLEKHLKGVKTVYFSPSGLLHRVNLAALPTGKKGKTLADRHQLRLLSSTRNLVVKNPQPQPAAGQFAALFGGIRYDGDSSVSVKTGAAFRKLENTKTEVERLEKRLRSAGLRTQIFTENAATEEAIKTLGRDTARSPDILHVATHGFFFDDPERKKEQIFGNENTFRWNENPLFRSGLAFAGANHVWTGGQPWADLEDGICTAYEISHLNLSNTKLAVLSACETGLGDIRGSEGVYGLQRAFKMAGVDYLLVSLWQVPDAQTAEFMDLFYGYWLGGEAIQKAFSKAQKRMRKRYGVFEWGAWVLIE